MRITYRDKIVKDYWAKRWTDIPVDHAMINDTVYPLKYAKQTIKAKDGLILEAGCGAGRILRYYHALGYNIIGIDYIEAVIEKIKEIDPLLRVEVGDITNLAFKDETFKYVLAFGLYHNLENGLEEALRETYRVIMTGGYICSSFRADNLQNRLTDWLAQRKIKLSVNTESANLRLFHKRNLTRHEFVFLFKKAGFKIISVDQVVNMPLLYKFASFRATTHKIFDENIARKEGYQLSWIGRKIQNIIMKYFPDQFCNIYVLIAQK